MALEDAVRETTITGKNQINLPAASVRKLGWERGDRLIVQVVGEDLMVLLKRPDNWTEAFAGKLSGVFGNHEEVLRYLAEERRGWGSDAEPGAEKD